ncbi:MAG: methyltransferase domain-containing protein [Pseudonocardiaceae bacterium]
MRVLDLGAGAGDVALLVARLVGPQGSVLGVEQSAEAVARAQRRIGVVIPVSLLKEPREPLRFILNRVYVPSPDAAPHA